MVPLTELGNSKRRGVGEKNKDFVVVVVLNVFLCVCVCVCTTCMPCLQRPKEFIRPPRSRICRWL